MASGCPPRFVLPDLTGGFDYEAIFAGDVGRGGPVLGLLPSSLWPPFPIRP